MTSKNIISWYFYFFNYYCIFIRIDQSFHYGNNMSKVTDVRKTIKFNDTFT